MKRFQCEVCGHEVFFDSSVCVRCGTQLGYVWEDDRVASVSASSPWSRCANAGRAGCTWLVSRDAELCQSCALTRTRPADDDLEGLSLFPVAEESKRHLLRDLARLNFPVVGKAADEEGGLAFDLLSSVDADVTIGHADGVVTIDLAEGDDSYREKVRRRLAEPYRTMLGHFRHETGHYFEWRLVESTPRIDEARDLFGDERADYQEAIDRHYADGSPDDWQDRFISEYATMHPYEDFAETWAHYLHIHDTLETAVAFDLVAPIDPDLAFDTLVTEVWSPFATSMNVVNRSLGQRDLYPFVLPRRVVEKLVFVDSLRRR
ncbi:hypothetical protein DEU34_2079 [Microbacterium sp. AG1240]|uniref:zinc-binding metallopeptidase family protein n=1 Tax=Microbacterium sp. AG1240 TaxID=2183992 RepID=UPI000EB41D4E|nr:putative zinc-binding metallopeptidase [Microbacterium sp. AG1240]RKT33481.1 hypothetical protein DEU34_2079 [Microbacterium sp. AG1240]